MSSQDYKAITTLAVAMEIIGYIFTLIHRSQSAFKYTVGTTPSTNPILSFLGSVLDGIYSFVLGFIGQIIGTPEWFNALVTIPFGIIIVMYIINKY